MVRRSLGKLGVLSIAMGVAVVANYPTLRALDNETVLLGGRTYMAPDDGGSTDSGLQEGVGTQEKIGWPGETVSNEGWGNVTAGVDTTHPGFQAGGAMEFGGATTGGGDGTDVGDGIIFSPGWDPIIRAGGYPGGGVGGGAPSTAGESIIDNNPVLLGGVKAVGETEGPTTNVAAPFGGDSEDQLPPHPPGQIDVRTTVAPFGADQKLPLPMGDVSNIQLPVGSENPGPGHEQVVGGDIDVRTIDGEVQGGTGPEVLVPLAEGFGITDGGDWRHAADGEGGEVSEWDDSEQIPMDGGVERAAYDISDKPLSPPSVSDAPSMSVGAVVVDAFQGVAKVVNTFMDGVAGVLGSLFGW